MSMSHSPWAAMRSLTRDGEVAKRKLAPGTIPRIARFARPYRRQIAVFLVLVVLDALLVVALPLLFKVIIDELSTGGGQDKAVVVGVALGVAVLAIVDSGLTLWQRCLSSQVGEGLIYDLRTRVFSHVQRMPVAFFTRTQTGALVSRLNTDVVGAQQAFTSTLVLGGLQRHRRSSLVLATMFWLSWQITLGALVLTPLFLLPARWVGRRLQAITREAMQLNAGMGTRMTERFNVSGALLVKLFGRLPDESAAFADQAGQVRDIGIKQAMYGRVFFTSLTLVASLATALVYGVGGILVIDGGITLGTMVALTALLGRLYGPLTALSNVQVDVMTALVSFERVFEVLDLPPMIDEKPGAEVLPRGPVDVELRDVSFRYPTCRRGVARLARVGRRPRPGAGASRCCTTCRSCVPAGTMTALVGPSGAGKTTITSLVGRLYDTVEGEVRVGGDDVRDVTLASLRDTVGVVTQDAHMFHETIRSNLAYARPEATDAELVDALRAAQIRDLVQALPGRARHDRRRPRLPALRRREAAARHRPAAAQGARRRRPRRGHRAPRLRVRGRGAARADDRARGPHLARHRAPPVDRA